ncbi:MDR family MFS transporter [Indiicoccus explosivorum]|uniref:MDR family MFS transporter n=1 Tax=Indiicoccus explosivorum TaxID=1917864 RepID=UPI000B452CA5|nr:MFS transporter [Indiicoccus explosivorum]
MRIRDWDRSLKVRLIGELFVNTSFWMVFPFLAIYFAEEFGKTTAGVLLVLSQVFSVAANLVGGYCADRFGRRTMLVFASVGQGVSFFIFALANSPWLDSPILGFAAFTLAGMCGSLYWPASQAMVADVVPEEHRSDVFAIFYTAINISVVIGPIAGAALFFSYRFELLLAIAVIFFALAAALRFLANETLKFASPDELATDPEKGWTRAVAKQLKEYRVILNDRLFLLFVAAGILGAQTFMQLDLLFPVYLQEAIEVQAIGTFFGTTWTVTGEEAFGYLLSENGLLVALTTVIITRFVVKFPEKWVFFTSALLYAVAMLIFPVTDLFWIFVAAMAIFTLGELMTAGLQQSFISKLAPEHMRGQYFAAASLRYTIGRMIAPLSIPMTAWIGFGWTFAILAILSVISGFVYLLMFAGYEKRPSH